MAFPEIAHPRSTLPAEASVRRALGDRDQSFVFSAAPTVAPGFHGALTFRYRDGRLTMVEIFETLVPDDAAARDSRPRS